VAVLAASPEEIVIAAAGEGEGVVEGLVEIVFEHAAPDQHVSGAIDHRYRPGFVTGRRVQPATR
jgi:hypothetical protein